LIDIGPHSAAVENVPVLCFSNVTFRPMSLSRSTPVLGFVRSRQRFVHWRTQASPNGKCPSHSSLGPVGMSGARGLFGPLRFASLFGTLVSCCAQSPQTCSSEPKICSLRQHSTLCMGPRAADSRRQRMIAGWRPFKGHRRACCTAGFQLCFCPLWVKSGKPQTEQMLSALLPKADIASFTSRTRFAPSPRSRGERVAHRALISPRAIDHVLERQPCLEARDLA